MQGCLGSFLGGLVPCQDGSFLRHGARMYVVIYVVVICCYYEAGQAEAAITRVVTMVVAFWGPKNVDLSIDSLVRHGMQSSVL